MTVCTGCKGTGQIEWPAKCTDCAQCKSTGKIKGFDCKACSGEGQTQQKPEPTICKQCEGTGNVEVIVKGGVEYTVAKDDIECGVKGGDGPTPVGRKKPVVYEQSEQLQRNMARFATVMFFIAGIILLVLGLTAEVQDTVMVVIGAVCLLLFMGVGAGSYVFAEAWTLFFNIFILSQQGG